MVRRNNTIRNHDAEAIMEALEFFIQKHGPTHLLTETMQRMYAVIRDSDTIHILED